MGDLAIPLDNKEINKSLNFEVKINPTGALTLS